MVDSHCVCDVLGDKPTSLMTAMDSQWEAVQHSIHSVAEAIVAIKQNLAAGDLLEQAGNGKRVKAGSDQLPDVKKKENIVNRTENVPQLSQLSSKRCFSIWPMWLFTSQLSVTWFCHAVCIPCHAHMLAFSKATLLHHVMALHLTS